MPNSWNIGLVSSLCMVLGTIFGATLFAFASDQQSAIGEFIWRWQTLLSALTAGGAASIAWVNVSRQIKLTILTREEDRIERKIPGLVDVHSLLGRLLTSFHITQSVSVLHKSLLEITRSDVHAALRDHLPRTDDVTRLKVGRALAPLIITAKRAEGAERHRQTLEKDAVGPRTEMEKILLGIEREAETTVKAVETLLNDLQAEIRRCERLLPTIRGQIDRHLFTQ